MALATTERKEQGGVYDPDGREVVRTTAQTTATTVGNIRQTVTTAGTAVKLNASSLPVKRAVVCALLTNTGVVVVGGSGVIAAAGTRNSPPLNAGDSIELGAVDLTNVYIDSTVSGEGVTVYFEA